MRDTISRAYPLGMIEVPTPDEFRVLVALAHTQTRPACRACDADFNRIYRWLNGQPTEHLRLDTARDILRVTAYLKEVIAKRKAGANVECV